MTAPVDRDALRSVIRQVLREVLPEVVRSVSAAEPRVEPVTIADDADLHAFVLRLLELYEDPARREAVRTGRLRFRLTGPAPTQAEPTQEEPAAPRLPAVRRVERGAVTESTVVAAAKEGARLVLGRRAVITPLARERARALRVPIEKEA
ncbi:hypothetical protein TH66_02415 [Carbonactinospora thermoautotrophica]|uniref:Uncharacterized protein n=1 Tax=Carbonactinospora thermoautotrophica TaxID=1469144 RepID=A0A132N7M7_9ACTN|nr:hypothetical protein [Carbonactinospora thermoautotrophica]KWX01192.1 hypothetical protein LI90_2220 [Carbonactinospora thermoautotrophica]KWX05542.1 hypothetical protein TH66_02415 [Carbonactinospora thermoautotrophica]KWX07957.1 hypothetical protein TR74_16980 [Carbonactinospora thermoautotrophica]